jgi:1,4-alpha-glucan branching enzyme
MSGQSGIGRLTPMGATIVDGGVTFRTWAPNARDVFLMRGAQIAETSSADSSPKSADRLISLGDGTWAGFAPGMGEGDPYLFWIDGSGSSGPKRDPHARELGLSFPHCPCLVHAPRRSPWHDETWRRPEGEGRDVVVVASFNETILQDYPIELPCSGSWNEVFNSDFYDRFPNPSVIGNGRTVYAAAERGRIYPATARMMIPANGAIVLARS